jgi:hypothetical protein
MIPEADFPMLFEENINRNPIKELIIKSKAKFVSL